MIILGFFGFFWKYFFQAHPPIRDQLGVNFFENLPVMPFSRLLSLCSILMPVYVQRKSKGNVYFYSLVPWPIYYSFFSFFVIFYYFLLFFIIFFYCFLFFAIFFKYILKIS